MTKIAVTGGTGFIGAALMEALLLEGFEVVCVTRDPERAAKRFQGWPIEFVNWDALVRIENISGWILLAGENVGTTRWTKTGKDALRSSRLGRVSEVARALSQHRGPKPWILSASAVGIFGSPRVASREPKVERDDVQALRDPKDFLQTLTCDWEARVTRELSPLAARLGIFRLGVVIGRDALSGQIEGALKKLVPIFLAGAGGPLGGGKQGVSWIALQDVVSAMIRFARDSKMAGTYHLTAPEPVDNEVFSRELGRALWVPAFFLTPAFLAKFALGEMSEMALGGERVYPERLLSEGFSFQHPTLAGVLADVLQPERERVEFFRTKTVLPTSRARVFEFFGQAENLDRITPEFLRFKTVRVSSETMAVGVILDHSLKLHGVPMRWRSEIASWNPPESFSDRQVRGPYRTWTHEHRFQEFPFHHFTLMTDEVRYALPAGCLGRIAGGAWVKKQVSQIFLFRRQSILKLF